MFIAERVMLWIGAAVIIAYSLLSLQTPTTCVCECTPSSCEPVIREVQVEKMIEVPVEKIVRVEVEKIVKVPVEKVIHVTIPAEQPNSTVGWYVRDNEMYASLQVAHLGPNGTLPIPEDTSNVYIEIGINSRDTLCDELDHGGHEKTFLLMFEPLIDKYAYLLSKNSGPDVASPLGSCHPRSLVFPFAVAAHDGALPFNVARVDGCSSLMKGNQKETPLHGWPDWVNQHCKKFLDRRLVPTISLETILRWINRTVAFIKVDAQGYDAEVILSARDQLHLVEKFVIEVVGDHCDPLYEGQLRCTEIQDLFVSKGFQRGTPACDSWSDRCESNLLFIR